MKRINRVRFNLKRLTANTAVLLLLSVFIFPLIIYGQTDSTAAKETTEETVAPLVEFTSIQKNDNSISLKASFKAKINGTLTKLSGLNLSYFIATDSGETELGKSITDNNGIALLSIKAETLVADKEGKLHFKAVFTGNKQIDAVAEELIVKRARLEMTTAVADSVQTVTLKLIDLSSGTETAIPETDLAVFVKRLFSSLKIGEGKTDENGEVSVEVPYNLPGDTKGNLTLQAKLEDNEIYGTLETSSIQKWGVPVSDEIIEMPRALWSTHPPIWMLITFIVLMTTVWGHYIVIIYELFRLRKEEPKTTIS